MDHPVSAEHVGLNALLEEVLDLLRGGEAESVNGAVERLRIALEAHFEQEDALHYPTVRALRPEHAAAVARFAEGHGRLRRELERVTSLLAAGELARGAAALAAFAEAFGRHEAAEEDVLRSLEAELEGSS
jgi:hypothetical protein